MGESRCTCVKVRVRRVFLGVNPPEPPPRCIERGVEACLERKAADNPPRPRKLDGASEAKLVQIACSPPPVGRARWTLSLLADRLVELEVFDTVSISTIQRGQKETISSRGS